MKKFTPVITLVVAIAAILAVSFSSASVQTSSAVQVPEAVAIAIQLGLTALVTAGTIFVFEKIGLDLRDFAIPVSMTLSAFLVGELQGLINIIPIMYDTALTIAFQIIVVILGSIGFFKLRQPPPTNSLL